MTVADVFDVARTEWEVTLSREELNEVLVLLSRLSTDRSQDIVLLKAHPNGVHEWTFRRSDLDGCITILGAPVQDTIEIVLTTHIIFTAVHHMGAMPNCSVYVNTNDDAVVLRAGDRVVFIDMPTFDEGDLVGDLHEHRRETADSLVAARVDVEDFLSFVQSADGLSPVNPVAGQHVRPRLLVEIAHGGIRGTTDWRRHGGPRVTTSIPCSANGTTTFSTRMDLVARCLDGMNLSGELTLEARADDPQFVFIAWHRLLLRVEVQYDKYVRWQQRIIDLINETGAEVFPIGPNTLNGEILYVARDCGYNVRILPGQCDADDRIRMYVQIADNVVDDIDTLRRVNTMNETDVDAKFMLLDGRIVAAIDFPAMDIEQRVAATVVALVQVREKFLGRYDPLAYLAASSDDQQ